MRLVECDCKFLCPFRCCPLVLVLVVALSDLHTGAVDMDPDMESNVRFSSNLKPLPPSELDMSLDDLDM